VFPHKTVDASQLIVAASPTGDHRVGKSREIKEHTWACATVTRYERTLGPVCEVLWRWGRRHLVRRGAHLAPSPQRRGSCLGVISGVSSRSASVS
jgi:hypothetical protein